MPVLHPNPFLGQCTPLLTLAVLAAKGSTAPSLGGDCWLLAVWSHITEKPGRSQPMYPSHPQA